MPDYPDGMREEVAALVPPSVTRLLDVGCARGGFGQALARRGIEIWGIEIDEAPAAIARQRLASVIVGAYPEAMPEGLTFDCISFIDVLEHMVNPVGALLAAHSHLVDGGYVVASIPNVRHRLHSSLPRSSLEGSARDSQDVGLLESHASPMVPPRPR